MTRYIDERLKESPISMIRAHTCAVFFFVLFFVFFLELECFLTVLWNLEEVSTRDNEEDNVP